MNRSTIRFRAASAVLAAALMALVAACGGRATSSISDSPLATPAVTGSPVATQTQEPSKSELPTPASKELATVGGILLQVQPNGESSPMAEAQLYLARVMRSAEGEAFVAGLDEKSSPAAMTDADGAFVFVDVPPDSYGLAVATPIGSFLITDEQGRDLLFEAEAGEALNVGTVRTEITY